MPLESLVEEIRRRGESELGTIVAERAAEASKIDAERERRIQAVREETQRTTEREIARERAQRLAGAHLAARKLLYEAREARVKRGLEETREKLKAFTATSEYASVLKRMLASANEALGKQIRVSGRAEDASALSRLGGKAFDPTPQPILGGLLAETSDGRRRLNLSFDELLRLRSDQVRERFA